MVRIGVVLFDTGNPFFDEVWNSVLSKEEELNSYNCSVLKKKTGFSAQEQLQAIAELEAEGIVGENMVFSEKEKNCAAGIPQTINNFFGNTSIITSPSDHVQIISGGENNITFSYSAVEQAVDEIEKRLLKERLSNDITERANELLSDIRSEIENKSKPNVLKSLLAGLGNILKDAGANALSGLIQAIIQGLF